MFKDNMLNNIKMYVFCFNFKCVKSFNLFTDFVVIILEDVNILNSDDFLEFTFYVIK